MTNIDLAIIGLYLTATIVIGLVLRRRAARSLKSYVLGGNTLPWPMLGLSNASGMFDISGTMWLVALCFVYGLKSIWIPWLWPVFNQVFLMMYLSVWLRRSNAMTGADWLTSRFGSGRGAELSQLIIIAFALLSVIGFLAYGFVGIGKFIEVFIPWETVSHLVPFDVPAARVPQFYGIVFTAVATAYVILGGMFSVVWTDLMQFTIMTIAAIAIAAMAMMLVSPAELTAAVPEGWATPFFGWTLDLDWAPPLTAVNEKIASDGYSLFGVLMMMMLFKGVLVSAAGPAPNYDMQKILATRSPREGALMSGFVSIVLMPVRYLMIAGFAVLAIVYYDRLNLRTAGGVDFENVLPAAIQEFAPVGLLGLIVAGLLAAFMSTFAATVNSAPAYVVNDVYKKYVNPDAGTKTLIYASYLVSIVVVLISTAIGFYVPSINSLLQWIVSGLWGGYTAANVLKWYWWRFNAFGYFWGMLSGIVGALILPLVSQNIFPNAPSDILPLYSFPILLVISSAVCIGVSLMTEPDDMEVLKSFYRQVRPWGFWGPVLDRVVQDDPDFAENREFRRDAGNVVVGIVAQTVLVALPIYLVIKNPTGVAVCIGLIALTAVVLKKTWYDQLPKEGHRQ